MTSDREEPTRRRQTLRGWTLALGLGAGCISACASPPPPSPTSDNADSGATWPASAESQQLVNVQSWSLRVPRASSSITLIGYASTGAEVVRVTLDYVEATESAPARHVLVLPEGELEILADGSVGKNTLPVAETATWDKLLLSGLLDRVAASGSGATTDIEPQALLAGAAQVVAANKAPLVSSCRGAMGEASLWSASQAALGCTSTGGDDRSELTGAPYDASLVRAANFDTSASRCASSSQALAQSGNALDHGCSVTAAGSVKLVSWGSQLLQGAMCLAGVAAAGASGALTYWVCQGTAVLGAGAGCSLVAPGVGTVTCGAAAGISAAPVCVAGSAAVAAGVAAAALPLCNVTSAKPNCPPDDYASLGQQKGVACDNLPNSCTELVRQSGGGGAICVGLAGRLGEFRKCKTARQNVIDQCFDGKPTDEGHAEQLVSMQKLIDACTQHISDICPTT